MKKNIIIVEAVSTGIYFVQDIIDRGYCPVVLNPRLTAQDSQSALCGDIDDYKSIENKCEIIEASDDYAKTLELVKSYNPLEIIPGSDKGVALSIRLCNDLGLRTNPVESIDAMTKKADMQLALKNAGIRYILGDIVSNSAEARKFLVDNNLNCGVVKPLHGAASHGVFICKDKEEVLNAVDNLIGKKDHFGDINEQCLVQERIIGTEYIVNTVSRDGVHRLASILVYSKSLTDEGGYIYNYCETVSIIKPGLHDLIVYAFQTLDAIGIKNGACHGEYMIDEKGPVLIEVNCRPMGLKMPINFLDDIFGHHETDAVLDAYLDKEKFLSDLKKEYVPMSKGFVKFIMVPNNIYVKSLPIKSFLSCMSTICEVRLSSVHAKQFYTKTIDLETHGGLIFMVDEDPNKVAEELYYLCTLEHFFFNFVLSDDISAKMPKDRTFIGNAKIMEESECTGSCLIVSDSEETIENARVIKPDEVKNIANRFDCVILSFNKFFENNSNQQILDLIIECFKKVKYGGKVIVSPQTYLFTTYSKVGFEFLMRNCGISINKPLQNNLELLIGTRRDISPDNIAAAASSF